MTAGYRWSALAAGAAVLLAGCGTGSAAPVAGAPAAAPAAPLATVATGPTGSWATVAMGHLDDPDNTFWEELYRPPGATAWSLRTPPGVADNGGLVTATNGSSLIVGVLASNKLAFSPLATSRDQGASYTPALLPSSLTGVPDALTAGADGSAYALSGGRVLASGPALTGWHSVFAGGAGGRSTGGCQVTELRAIALTAQGPAIGAQCSLSGSGAVFILGDGTQRDLSPPHAGDTVGILRLVGYGQGLATLVRSNHGTAVTAAWDGAVGGPWTESAPLPAATVVSTSVSLPGAFSVLWRDGGGVLRAASIGAGDRAWKVMPPPPAATAAVAIEGGRADALAVDVTTFSDYELTDGRWLPVQHLDVPLAFGSSG